MNHFWCQDRCHSLVGLYFMKYYETDDEVELSPY